ncbi:MAG: DUF72 domain-containing protein [archaeon]|nr:DUF72 domain-containing protein [archaeon]MCP8306871.1 DUF72 domain-containing protein [archaeon]
MEIFVGCCGTAGLSLKDYSDNFEVIEIQSTFYRLPFIKTVENWCKRVKKDFKFTVKAFQGITHPVNSPTWRRSGSQRPVEKVENYGHLKPTEENFECWKNTVEVCKILDARVCVVQLPPSFTCTEDNAKNMTEFFKNVEKPLKSVKIAIEVRHKSWYDNPSILRHSLEEIGAIQVLDPLSKELITKSSTCYYRLHGLGERFDYRYQHRDDELSKLLREVRKTGWSESFVMFNNLSMHEDAIRFKGLVEEGSLPPLEGGSLEERLRVVLKGIRFPINAEEISKRRGFLLIRIDERVSTLGEIVKMSGLKDFNSFVDLLKAIKKS